MVLIIKNWLWFFIARCPTRTKGSKPWRQTRRIRLIPTGPQPGVHPGPGWRDNFNTTGTCHYFVIPDGNQDVIAPFVQYNLDSPFPKLLATNGQGCTVHSCPLYASPCTSCTASYSPQDELLFWANIVFTPTINWAVTLKDNPTLAGEIQHFCSHQKMC